MNDESKQLLHTSSSVWIPPMLTLCPYCGAQMGVKFTAFEQNDDGTWSVTEIETECGNEPQPIAEHWEDEWENWNESHSDMPYVYQLPVEKKIIEWVNSKYYFDPEGEDKLAATR